MQIKVSISESRIHESMLISPTKSKEEVMQSLRDDFWVFSFKGLDFIAHIEVEVHFEGPTPNKASKKLHEMDFYFSKPKRAWVNCFSKKEFEELSPKLREMFPEAVWGGLLFEEDTLRKERMDEASRDYSLSGKLHLKALRLLLEHKSLLSEEEIQEAEESLAQMEYAQEDRYKDVRSKVIQAVLGEEND